MTPPNLAIVVTRERKPQLVGFTGIRWSHVNTPKGDSGVNCIDTDKCSHCAAQAPIRLWAPGCSTGEEAYSLAIVVRELLDEKGTSRPVQIFGTDVSDRAGAQRAVFRRRSRWRRRRAISRRR